MMQLFWGAKFRPIGEGGSWEGLNHIPKMVVEGLENFTVVGCSIRCWLEDEWVWIWFRAGKITHIPNCSNKPRSVVICRVLYRY